MKKFLNKIYLWWKFSGRYYHTDFYIGVKNLVKWLPIIWIDRDWDGYHIYAILQHKIRLQSLAIKNRDTHYGAQKDSEKMMTCVRLMEKVKNDFYGTEYIDYYKSKHWFKPISGGESSTWESEIIEENFSEYFKKYPLIYKRVLKGEGFISLDGLEDEKNRKLHIAMNMGWINQERARKTLFRFLESKIEFWWD